MKHIIKMTFGMFCYYLIMPFFNINSNVFIKALPYIGYFANCKWIDVPLEVEE